MPKMVMRLSLLQSVVLKLTLLHYQMHEIASTLLLYTNE